MNKQVMEVDYKIKDAMTVIEHFECGEGAVKVIELSEYVAVVEELKKRASIEIKKDRGHFSLLFNKGENSYLVSMCEVDSVMGDILNEFI